MAPLLGPGALFKRVHSQVAKVGEMGLGNMMGNVFGGNGDQPLFQPPPPPMLASILFVTLSPGHHFFGLKLEPVRSPLYRGRFLRPNMRWKALDEIYNFHILAFAFAFAFAFVSGLPKSRKALFMYSHGELHILFVSALASNWEALQRLRILRSRISRSVTILTLATKPRFIEQGKISTFHPVCPHQQIFTLSR